LSQITFEGSPQLQATKVRREPMKIVIDEDKRRLPCNRAPPRKHSKEKQKEIRKQVDALLELGVIKESQALSGVKSI
jgi:hypothetical protein